MLSVTFCLSLSVCPFVFVPFCLSACLPPCLCVCLPVSFPFLSLSQTCIRMRAHVRMLQKTLQIRRRVPVRLWSGGWHFDIHDASTRPCGAGGSRYLPLLHDGQRPHCQGLFRRLSQDEVHAQGLVSACGDGGSMRDRGSLDAPDARAGHPAPSCCV